MACWMQNVSPFKDFFPPSPGCTAALQVSGCGHSLVPAAEAPTVRTTWEGSSELPGDLSSSGLRNVIGDVAEHL